MKAIDENHSFNVRIAKITGSLEKALLLKEIYGWCFENHRNKKHIYVDCPWTFYSARELSKKFFYMTRPSIGRRLLELEKDGWLFSANFNKKKYDATKWYTINHVKYDKAALLDFDKIETAEQILNWEESFKQQEESWINDLRGKIETLAQNEQWVAQNEQCNSQNEQPIPSLTTSLTSNTTFLGKIEKSKSENIETVLDENSECLQPFPENMPYGNGLKRAQEALNAYYAQDGKLDELKLEVGYDISSSFLDEQKKSFIEKMSNYAHNRARTFSQLKGFFVSWVRTGYERSQKEQTAKATITSVQADFTELEISVAAADVLAQLEPTAKGVVVKKLTQLKSKTPAQILKGFAEFLGKIKEHSASLKAYTPLAPKQLIWLELNCQDKNKLIIALLHVVKYHPKTQSLLEAIKIQLI